MLSKNKVKYIQTLYHKKQRLEENLFIVDGDKMVLSALTFAKLSIQCIYATKEWINQHQLLLTGIQYEEVTEVELAKISKLTTPNKALAIIYLPTAPPLPNPHEEWIIALDGIQDPGNLGTIIRTADWFGIKQIVCSEATVDCYNPKVIQSTMGSVFTVSVQYTDIVAFVKKYPAVPCYCTTLKGNAIQTMHRSPNGILIIGNEGTGITEAVLQLSHQPVTITGKGNAESLNAAVATGIALAYVVK